MKISIIVPVYNTAEELPKCIDSILSQSFLDYEVILVDDGSPDCAGEICDTYAKDDARIRVIHQKNSGLSEARNAGLVAATGEYILFMDSDDFYTAPGVLERLAVAAKESGADLLCFDYARTDGVALCTAAIGDISAKEIEDRLEILVRANAYQSSVCSKLLQKKMLSKNRIRFEKGRLSEDIVFSGLLLAKADKIAYVPLPAYAYRVREGSISSKVGVANVRDQLHAVEVLAKLACRDQKGRRKAVLGYTAFQYCTLLLNWRLAGSPEREEIWPRIRKYGWLLRYSDYSRVKMIAGCSRVFGLSVTSFLLCQYYKITNR